jgi:hypothetical protein
MIEEAGLETGGDFEGDGGEWGDLWGGITCVHTAVKNRSIALTFRLLLSTRFDD